MKIFFMHNPKAGGSAVRTLFQSHFSEEQTAPIIENSPAEHRRLAGRYQAYSGYDYYWGHYGYRVFESVGDGHLLVTNFRNPVSRIVSLYNYWRNNVSSDAAYVREAQEKSFSGFIRSKNPDLQLYTRDAHFRQIFNTCWEPECGSKLSILKVFRRIRRMHWFYVAEYPAISMMYFRHRFKGIDSQIPVAENVSQRSVSELSIPAEDVNFILKTNKRDTAIYAFAFLLLLMRVMSARIAKMTS